MGQWWLMGRDRVATGPVTTELVLEGIRTGKIRADALACEVGASDWRSIRNVRRFAPALAKLRVDGPTLVDALPVLPPDVEDPTLSNVVLSHFDDPSERTIADSMPFLEQALSDDFLATQPFDDGAEITLVERRARISEPPP